MTKLLLAASLLLYTTIAYSQQTTIVFKKGHQTIDQFWPGTFITFQLANKQWQKGELTKIGNDSFYIRPMIVHYHLMGADTVYFKVLGFALEDVYAMPKKGYLIAYKDDRFQISGAGGHVHFYWIKSGWLFRTGAAGYAALHVANGLIKDDHSFNAGKLGIAAAIFGFGVFLKRAYKPVLRLRKKYRLEVVDFSNQGNLAAPVNVSSP